MLVISDSPKGAVSLVFNNVDQLDEMIKGLQELKEYHATWNKGFPATYTQYRTTNPNEKEIDQHVLSAKKAFLA